MKSVKKTWVLAALAVIAAAVLFIGGKISAAPSEQFQPPNSISVVPIQTSRDNYGIAMVDTKNETIWVYEITGRGTTYNKLKLLAARSWKYDKLLESYNCVDPKPEQVKNFVTQAIRDGQMTQPVEANESNGVIAEPNQ